MMNQTLNPISALVGVALVSSLGLAQAEGNPFVAKALDSGYDQLAQADAEGKCGASGAKDEEGKCGEGKCGEGACGASDDGQDGEGQSGAAG